MLSNIYSILVFTLLFFSGISNAGGVPATIIEYGTGVAELYTCRLLVSQLKFDYTILNKAKYSKSWDAQCGYPPAIGTLLLCCNALKNNDTAYMEHTIFKKTAEKCASYSSYNYSATFYKEQFENATAYEVPLASLNTSKYLYVPTIPDTAKQAKYYKQYNAMNFDFDSGTWFSVGIFGYFSLLILISSIFNIFRRLGFTKKLNGFKLSKLIQGYIIYPALLPNGKFSQPYGFKYFTFLIGNRIQFIVEVILVGLQVAFYSVNYRYAAQSALPTYVGYRSGVMAFGKIPLLILFAGRNNFLLYITGWSYCTCLHFHKILAFWMSIDALIHSVAFTIAYLGKYVAELKSTYFAVGVAATVFCGIIIGHSFHSLRSLNYEIFLASHVVLVICFLATCWYHCFSLGNLEWIVAACCVWFFDRVIRVFRMVAFGYRPATITTAANMLIKVEVNKPSWWHHSPGNFGFIYFANYIFWENNPFTIVNEDDKICAYIRVKKGVTSRIWKKLHANNGKMALKVCIEGPYGGELAPIFKKYDDVIYIAGGSGVPGIVEAATCATAGKLIWITQTMELVHAYKNLINRVNIPIEIFITRENSTDTTCSKKELMSSSESDSQSTDISAEKSNEKENVRGYPEVTIHYTRPDISTLINQNVKEFNTDNIAIVSCGPPLMMDTIRGVISKNISSWDKSVEYFDELQTW